MLSYWCDRSKMDQLILSEIRTPWNSFLIAHLSHDVMTQFSTQKTGPLAWRVTGRVMQFQQDLTWAPFLYGGGHRLWTPDEAFFLSKYQFFGLGRQFEQINFWPFRVLLVNLTAPITECISLRSIILLFVLLKYYTCFDLIIIHKNQL